MGFSALVSSVLLILLLYIRRLLLVRNERIKEHVVETWRPVFAQVIIGNPPEYRPIPVIDRLYILELWLYFRESLKDRVSVKRLLEFAQIHGFDRFAVDYLRSRSFDRRFIGLQLCRHLGITQLPPQVLTCLKSNNQTLVYAAALALSSNPTDEHLSILLDLLIRNNVLHKEQAAAVAQGLGPARISAPLATAASSEDSVVAARALGLFAYGDPRLLQPVTLIILKHASDTRVLLEALRAAPCNQGIDLIKPLLKHEDWRVRVRAVTALAGRGERVSILDLMPLLRDTSWWVRFRTAQTLINLCNNNQQALGRILTHEKDPYARDALAYAIKRSNS